jgi:hypothetical protein
VVFKKLSGGLSAGDNETKAEGRLKTSILALDTPGVSFAAMDSLVSNAIKGKNLKKIPALPNIKTRTKKLEDSERQKRDRKKDQARRKAQEDQKPPQAAANDGTKEGRRLERERRRAEHNAANNVKPKTPEEIAEMERKRRQRMQEEAEKWNIGAEDAPEEGGGIEEDWEEESDGDGEYEDIDEEDDEDVMDLD